MRVRNQADIAQKAERGHAFGRGPGFDAGYPLQDISLRVCSGTTAEHASFDVQGRPECAAQGRLRSRSESTSQRGTALALEHNRNEIEAHVARQEEQPPCKRQVTRSRRRRGHHHPEALVELTLRGWKSAATIGRRRNPSPDGSWGRRGSKPCLGTSNRTSLAQQDSRAPVYEAGGRTFESCTRYQPRVCGRAVDCAWL